jgi:auxin influx carrier (AUX1 LAX family)
VIPIWFLAIIFPFFGPINSTVGSLLVSFTVYIIPALAHMVTFASAPAREVINLISGLSYNFLFNKFIYIYIYSLSDLKYK